MLVPGAVRCEAGSVVDLVVLITTIPSARDARDAIRQTWGNKTHTWSKNTRFVFLFGAGYTASEQRELQNEAEVHGDILQEGFLDNYYNLSLKVIMGYRWVRQSCPQAAFIARSADDNFINIPGLLDLLKTGKSKFENVMFGDCITNAMPWRWPFHKWAISVKEYSGLTFPPYCIGTTFLTSFPMMEALIDISPHVPFFPIEDVYFGMCMKQLGGKYQNQKTEGFNLLPLEGSSEGGGCPYPAPLYTVHPLTPRHIRHTWGLCRPRTGHM